MLKTIGAYTSILLAWALCAGCGVGHNEILFVTKTNASIELDATPPTATVGIGRIEGEFSPQFEDGQKIPTLASFKFENDDIFAPYLGSTFAVGDAAMAMATLYDKPTPTKNSPNDYNSAIELTPNPNAKLLEYGEVRPVFFGTDTSFGLTLGWSGLSAQYPDTVRLGYVRKELALVPISRVANDSKHRVSAASLLATVDSNVKSEPVPGEQGIKDSRGVDLDYLQYFATGKAATLMAMQEDVRKAMIARLDPNRDTVITLGGALPAEKKHVAARLLGIVYNTLKDLENESPPDLIAAEHRKRLDKAAKSFGIPSCYFNGELGLKYIKYINREKKLKIWDDCRKNEPGPFNPDKFQSAVSYWRALSDTVREAREAIEQVKSGRLLVTLFKNDVKHAISNWEEVLNTLATQVERHRYRIRDLDAKIAGNRNVVAAYQYISSMLQ